MFAKAYFCTLGSVWELFLLLLIFFMLSLVFASENINQPILFGNYVLNFFVDKIRCLNLIKIGMFSCLAKIEIANFWRFHLFFFLLTEGFLLSLFSKKNNYPLFRVTTSWYDPLSAWTHFQHSNSRMKLKSYSFPLMFLLSSRCNTENTSVI